MNKITQSQLRRIIKEEVSRITEDLDADPRAPSDPERMLGDISKRTENLANRIADTYAQVKDDKVAALLFEVLSEVRGLSTATYKFRHDYRPKY